ncbi:hypothetical protein B0T16DRAFT_337759, partial [Cercophora newfieldiana]
SPKPPNSTHLTMVSTRSASAALATPRRTSPSAGVTPLPSPTKRAARSSTTNTAWIHAPHPLSIAWLAVSVPLVFWDLLYVFLRPHSMPGGKFHWPIWSPYAIQAELDLQYGFKKWNEGDGFNAAQSAMNVLENLIYLTYLGLWYKNKGKDGELRGKVAAVAVVLLYTGLVTTVGKTVLYWLNEAFSGFDNIGHNSWPMLALWIGTNGSWIVFPAIIGYVTGAEIVNGLAKASGGSRKND